MTEENMSKLEELIQQYCPDGVEYVRLGDVLSVNRGKRLTKTQLSEDGKYFVYHGSKDTPLGKYSMFNVKGNTTIVVNTGGIGGVKFCADDFWCSDGSFWIGHSALLNDKYVYYYLSPKESYFASQKRVGGVPTIDRSTVENVEIPVPPLPVQEEIVRILDTFTELQAELQAELQKRLQQYNYYRDFLLSFEGRTDVQWKRLEDLGVNLDRKRKPIASGKRVRGNIPYYGASGIVDYVKGYIFDGDYLLVSEDGANLLTRTYPIAFSIHGKTWVNNHAHVIEFKERATRKYVEYYLNSIDLSLWISAGAQPKLTQDSLNKLTIPVPPLAEQQRVVSILDRFDTLTTDLTQGLPAEIEKRRQQYEYYRDKLLTFKRKEA